MKNKIPTNKNFFFSDDVKDTNLNIYYKKSVIGDIGYKKIEQDEFLNLSISRWKTNIAIFIIIGVVILVLCRLCYLQIYKGEYYLSVAEGNRIRIETIAAPRGLIYDRNRNLLVNNIPDFTLTIIKGDLPSDAQQKKKIFQALNSITNIKINEIKSKLAAGSLWGETEIASNLKYDQAIKLMILEPSLSGVHCLPVAKREYIEPLAMSHAMGYIGRINVDEIKEYEKGEYLNSDNIGKSGIESYYESTLKGVYGKKQVEVDSSGNEIKVIAQKDPEPGDDLILSIDLELQKKAYEAIEKYSHEQDAKGGALIALDPRNGEVLALVSWPGFNSNDFINGIDYDAYQKLLNDPNKPLYNKAVSGEYPSGSTFKLIVASAALQENVITKNTTVNSTGGIPVNQWFFPDWKAGGHGETDVIKAIAESVNTFFYLAGGGYYDAATNLVSGGLGIERIDHYAELFGLNIISGIDIAGEKTGFLPTKDWKKTVKAENWYIGDTYNASIGQGDILVTPLQVADYTAVIANGGTLYRPHLVKEIVNETGEVQEMIGEQVINSNFVNQQNLNIVKQGMKAAAVWGSAKALTNLSVSSGAKTGTAQHGGDGKNHSWFTAFAPYDNPEIVITAIIDEGGDGTEAALPAVYEVLDWYFSR
ncbi:MAG: penicillin-binding protein 2 [Patescibacteria group bacterium]